MATFDGKRVLIGTGIALAAVLSGVTGGLWWLLNIFTFESFVNREAHQAAALGLVVWAMATAVLGGAVWVRFRAPVWSLVVVVLAVLAQVAGAVHELAAASGAPRSGFDDYTAKDLWLLPACPTSWPLLLFVLVAVVQLLRARWSPGPRPLQARSAAPGHQPSR
jgi:hypothetical protein